MVFIKNMCSVQKVNPQKGVYINPSVHMI